MMIVRDKSVPSAASPVPPDIQLFTYSDRQVRTVLRSGEPWFVAGDVCAILGIGRPQDSVRYLDDDERGRCLLDTPSGPQEFLVVNEPGLYSLILRSRKPEAKAFKRWVTHEVIPSIRKTGAYGVPALPDLSTAEGVVAMADLFAATARRLAAAEEKVVALEPAAESWNTLATAQGDYLVGDAAKILSRHPKIQTGQNRLFTTMERLGWVYRGADRRWRIYQTAIETGRLMELPSSHYHPRTGELVLDPPQVRVTVKGLDALRRHLVAEAEDGAV